MDYLVKVTDPTIGKKAYMLKYNNLIDNLFIGNTNLSCKLFMEAFVQDYHYFRKFNYKSEEWTMFLNRMVMNFERATRLYYELRAQDFEKEQLEALLNKENGAKDYLTTPRLNIMRPIMYKK
jgi:hypothetical protein